MLLVIMMVVAMATGTALLSCTVRGFLSLDHKFHPQGGLLQQLCFVEPVEPTPLLLASSTVVFN